VPATITERTRAASQHSTRRRVQYGQIGQELRAVPHATKVVINFTPCRSIPYPTISHPLGAPLHDGSVAFIVCSARACADGRRWSAAGIEHATSCVWSRQEIADRDDPIEFLLSRKKLLELDKTQEDSLKVFKKEMKHMQELAYKSLDKAATRKEQGQLPGPAIILSLTKDAEERVKDVQSAYRDRARGILRDKQKTQVDSLEAGLETQHDAHSAVHSLGRNCLCCRPRRLMPRANVPQVTRRALRPSSRRTQPLRSAGKRSIILSNPATDRSCDACGCVHLLRPQTCRDCQCRR
jgi:hypothetical protein